MHEEVNTKRPVIVHTLKATTLALLSTVKPLLIGDVDASLRCCGKCRISTLGAAALKDNLKLLRTVH